MPLRLRRSILRPEEHEICFEVAAAPVLRPGSEDTANISLCIGVRDIEAVVLLTALVPAKLAIKLHWRDRFEAAALAHDPVGVLGVQATAIADHERCDPEARNESGCADLGEQRRHAAREAWLYVEPVAHFGREAVVDLEDFERHLIAIAKSCSGVQMLEQH